MTPGQRDVERAEVWLRARYEEPGEDYSSGDERSLAEQFQEIRAEAMREAIEQAGVAELLAVTRGWIEINERQFSMVPPAPESKAYQFAMARIARTHEAIDRVERALAAAPAAREEGK